MHTKFKIKTLFHQHLHVPYNRLLDSIYIALYLESEVCVATFDHLIVLYNTKYSRAGNFRDFREFPRIRENFLHANIIEEVLSYH